MNPEIAQRIAKTEDGQALIAYLKESIADLDTNADLIELADDRQIAIEVKGRAYAQAKLRKLWKTLLDQESVSNNGGSEYAVD